MEIQADGETANWNGHRAQIKVQNKVASRRMIDCVPIQQQFSSIFSIFFLNAEIILIIARLRFVDKHIGVD